MKHLLIIASLIIATFVSLFLFEVNRSVAPRLVLLYATCSVNKNLLGPYNQSVHYTPNLNLFAKQSVVFARHETESPFSGAAYAALFSGTSIYRHGIYYHPARLRDESYLIAEAFRDNGYETFFWNGHDLASDKWNYAQGVSSKNIFHGHPSDGRTLTFDDDNFKSLLIHLSTDANYKAFVQVNFFMTHAPYSNYSNIDTTEFFCQDFPVDCDGITKSDLIRYTSIYSANHVNLSWRFDETIKSLKLNPAQVEMLAKIVEVTYKSDLHLLDRSFGKTLDAINEFGLSDNSLIVFTADHGEILYRKDSPLKWFHSCLEPEVLGIPLIIRLQSGKPQVFPKITRSIDVFPTIATLCKVKIRSKNSLEGIDLSDAILGRAKIPDLTSYSCSELTHPAMVKSDPHSMVVQARAEDTVFRLPSDSEQLHIFDVSGGFPREIVVFDRKSQKYSEMKNLLINYRRRLIQNFSPPTNESGWEELRERMRSLGYIRN
jgi:arylsulfatase A-like enzyme